MSRSFLLCLLSLSLAAAEVEVRILSHSYQVVSAEAGARGAKPGQGEAKPGHYPIKGTEQRHKETVEVVELDNGLVTAVICPAWGGRLLRVTDNQTGVDYFQVRAEIQDHMPWQAGGVKASFPFFEHGLPLRVPAGWRVVRGADGSAAVAMDLRFSRFRSAADQQRYGRFSEEILSVVVGLEPGSTMVSWQQRKDNPGPLPRGDRFWNLTCFPQQWIGSEVEEIGKDGTPKRKRIPDKDAMRAATRFLFPATWVTDHGPTTVHSSPHWSSLDNWEVSHFALEMAAPFVGAFYPQEPVLINRLRIDQRGERVAAKLYTAFWADMVEHWGGVGDVFEHPGVLRPAHAPVAFIHRFWITQGLGEVDWADERVALAIEGERLQLQTPREHAQCSVFGADGALIASGPSGPHRVLEGTGDTSRIRVELDGETVLDQRFPLARPVPAKDEVAPPAIQARFEQLAGPNPQRLELESFGHNEGMPGAMDAKKAVATISAEHDPVHALSVARAAWRLGEFEQVARVCALFPGPEADLLLGLLALERGEDHDFGSAGWEADWLRALVLRRQDDSVGALAALERYLAQVPDAWYPRLAEAYWCQDAAAAQALASEHPASPEAQLVLRLLGQPDDLDALLRDRAEAAQQLAGFRRMLEAGAWTPPPRYTDSE